MITALVVLLVAGVGSDGPVTQKPPQRKPPQVKVEEPAEETPEKIPPKKAKPSNEEIDAEADAELHKRVIGGGRTYSADTARRMMAAQQAAHAVAHTMVEVRVTLEGTDAKRVYVARIGDRVIASTNSPRDIANAIPAVGVRRIDLSALGSKEQDVFKASVPADERARLEFVQKSEPLFDPRARPVPDSLRARGPVEERNGRFRQEAEFKVGGGKPYTVHVTASKPGIVARFFELLGSYFRSSPPHMSAQAIVSAVTKQVIRENKIKDSDLQVQFQVQIKDDLKLTIYAELLLRRLIDAG
jgi:hypothetical protein